MPNPRCQREFTSAVGRVSESVYYCFDHLFFRGFTLVSAVLAADLQYLYSTSLS